MAGMRATKKPLEFVREMDIPRFRGVDKVRVADLTPEETTQYADFLKRDQKKRSAKSYQNVKKEGNLAEYKPTSILSSREHEHRKMLGSKHAHIIYDKKKVLSAYGKEKGLTMKMNMGLEEMRNLLRQHHVSDETLRQLEASACTTSPTKRKEPDENGVRRPGPCKKPKEPKPALPDLPLEELNHKQLSAKLLAEFLDDNPHLQPRPDTVKALHEAWPEEGRRYTALVHSVHPDKYKAANARSEAKRRGTRTDYNKKRRKENHEHVLEIERRYQKSDKGKARKYRICSFQGCDNYARAPGTLCKGHGGGVRCQHPGCENTSQDGATQMCRTHGGGYRYECSVCSLFAVSSPGGECWTCRKGTKRWRQFEYMVSQKLQEDDLLQHWSYQDKKIPCSSNTRRGDFTYLLPDRVVILEVDEHCHRYYERDCEVTRVLDLHEQCAGKPLIMLRFNPLQQLLDDMIKQLHLFMSCPVPDILQVEFLGYPEHLQYDMVEEVERMMAERANEEDSDSTSSES